MTVEMKSEQETKVDASIACFNNFLAKIVTLKRKCYNVSDNDYKSRVAMYNLYSTNEFADVINYVLLYQDSAGILKKLWNLADDGCLHDILLGKMVEYISVLKSHKEIMK